MLAAHRQMLVLQTITDAGAGRISELASNLKVSEMTIRRDIEALADKGLVIKTRGGAIAVDSGSSATEHPFQVKSLREQTAKEAIARRASEIVAPASAVALMGGSTVFALAAHLVNTPHITVVTNSLPVSDLFHRTGRSDQTVILAGGMRTPTDSFVGEITVSVFEKLNVDYAFMGAHGVDPRGGYTSPNLLESETNRAVRQHAKKLVILADHTKWGQIGFSTFAELADAQTLITDQGTPADVRAVMESLIPEVIFA